MSSPDDRHRVEFLDAEPSDGADEELEQPAERAWLRKARLPLLVAAAVALVAVVVANVLTGSHGTPAAGPATVTSTPTPSSTPTTAATSGSVVLRLPAGRSVELPRGELTCQIATACAVELDTPNAVRTAIRRAVPKATHLQTITVNQTNVANGRLSARQITAHAGTARLVIEIRPAASTDRLLWNASETAARTTATVRTHVDDRLIALDVTAPPGYPIDLPALRRLAADPRLLDTV